VITLGLSESDHIKRPLL
jgi:hypothetical protein